MSKRAVIVVDLQKDYLASGKFALVGMDAAIENAARIVAMARRSGDLVINVRHEGPTDAPFFVSGTEGGGDRACHDPAGGRGRHNQELPQCVP